MGENQSNSSTVWSVILRAQGTGPVARAAYGDLIRRYERAVLAYFRRARRPPGFTPEDLKQEFFARVLKGKYLSKLDPERGRFRGWLHKVMQRFLAGLWRTFRIQTTSLEAAEQAGQLPAVAQCIFGRADIPEEMFLRAFDEDTLRHVLERLRVESPNKERFEIQKRFLVGRQMDLVALSPIAKSMGLKPGTLAKSNWDLHQRYKKYLREAIAETLDLDAADPEAQPEIDLEMRRIRDRMVDVPDSSPPPAAQRIMAPAESVPREA